MSWAPSRCARTGWASLSTLATLAIACGSVGGNYVDVGSDDAAGSFVPSPGDGAASGALDAYIEDSKRVVVSFVTLNCAGDCATVQAVGTGGDPPYAFAWEDGTTGAVRKVCPTSTTNYSVKVTDTGMTGEFARPSEMATASLTADVLACPDASVVAGDAGVTACETIATIVPSGAVTGAPGTGDAGAESCPSSASGTIAAISAAVALQAGEEYEFVENSTGSVLVGPAPVWSYYASASDCNSAPGGQSLGSMTFDPNTPVQSLCFRANASYAHLDWFSTAVAAGVANGTWQLCRGCDHPDASP